MSQRFQTSDYPTGILGSMAVWMSLLLLTTGCDSTEPAVSDHAPAPITQQAQQQDARSADTLPERQDRGDSQNPSNKVGMQEAKDTGSEQSTGNLQGESEGAGEGPKVAPLPVQFQGPDAEARALKVDPERLKANGIRTIEGERLILHTDLPLDDELRSLPELFEKATIQFCRYFEIQLDDIGQWQVRACVIQEMDKFKNAGLLPQVLPPFKHGYALGDRVFLREQPSEYYRRHLLIHEGVHSFMLRFFKGAGPPWYMEGMAELLATHQWDGEKLTIRSFPADKTEVPFWGRVKIIKDDVAAQKGKMIEEVMQYGSNAHLNVEAYGWSWAATTFLDHHPEFQGTFRKHLDHAADSSPQFSLDLIEAYGEQWFRVRQQWQLFVMNMEYGYDISREAIDDVDVQEFRGLPAQQTLQVKADRGWQSTGLAVTKGMKIQLDASGRFVIHQPPEELGKPDVEWESEPDGITLRYYKGNPLGKLLVAIDNLNQTGLTGLVSFAAIGSGGELEIPYDGVLYLRVNDSPAELEDNRGEIVVKLSLVNESE